MVLKLAFATHNEANLCVFTIKDACSDICQIQYQTCLRQIYLFAQNLACTGLCVCASQAVFVSQSNSLNGSRAVSVERDYERKTERKKLSCCNH